MIRFIGSMANGPGERQGFAGWAAPRAPLRSRTAAAAGVLAAQAAALVLERAHHEGYWQWKAGGSFGHKLGSAGASEHASGASSLLRWRSARPRLSP